jgi:hypothetical protein
MQKTKLWFDSCFRNRYQRVLITNNYLKQNNFSTWEEMEHVVLQGSFLAHCRSFLTYVHDLPRTTKDKKTMMYADDTSILLTIPNK